MDTNTALRIMALESHVLRLENENEALRHEATHDPLTGLLNRRGLFEHVFNFWHGQQCTVTVADGDGVKRINDAHGHLAGDARICEIAETLTNNATLNGLAWALVARTGGDEFVIITAGHSLQESDLYSHGSVAFVAGVDSFDAAIREADVRMYHAKGERARSR